MPDCDALGAQYGLAKWIELNFTDKKLLIIGEIDNNHYQTYFKPYPNPELEVFQNALAISVDTPVLERIDQNQLFELCKTTVVVDHHPIIEEFADHHFGGISFSATCEYMGLKFMQFANNEWQYKINPTICNYLMLGLITDTNRFYYSSTNKNTFNVAAFLVDGGADLQTIYKFLYLQKLSVLRLTAYILQNFQLTSNNVAYIILKSEILSEYKVSIYEAKELVHTLQNIKNVHYCVFSVYDRFKKFYHTSIRSDKQPINPIAQSFGGGGHALACGVKLKTKEQILKLINELNELASLPVS